MLETGKYSLPQGSGCKEYFTDALNILSVNVCLHVCWQSPLMRLMLIMQQQRHHEMNLSASVCVWITSKPAISHFYSFVLSFITPVGEWCFYLQPNKERSCEKYDHPLDKRFWLPTIFVDMFSICIGFHQEHLSLLGNYSGINKAIHSFKEQLH